MNKISEHIIPHLHKIDLEKRVEKGGQRPLLLWFTGLSGSGKSTLANAVESHLFELGYKTYILDGDNIRSGLNNDLDFSDYSRKENIRRISEVARLFIDASIVTMTAFISPFKEDRETARRLVGERNFIEIFVDCPLEVCEKRDVKGLYGKARKGEIPNFTGIDSPFEAPENPEIHIKTNELNLEQSRDKILDYIMPKIEKHNA